MILLFLVLAVTSASKVEKIGQHCPSCILLNTTCYKVFYLFDLEAPFRKEVVIHKLGILRSTKTLFYSFEPTIEDEEYYKIGFVNLKNPNQSGIISSGQILNLGTFDIDQANNIIYFGGNDGVFVLDTNTNKISSYSSRGDTITNVFFRNQVYFVKYEDKGIIVKIGDNFLTKLEYWPVKKFVVTKDNVIVFLSNLGLFVSKDKIVHRVSKNAFFRGLTIDMDDVVFAWWIDGIYKVVLTKNLVHSKVVRLAELPPIGAMTFDYKNNLLFTSDQSLYIMELSPDGCGVKLEEEETTTVSSNSQI